MVNGYQTEHPIRRERRPLRAVVTGAAGFIGSHLVDGLLAEGTRVVGIDNLDPWYAPETKLANLTNALANPSFAFHNADLTGRDLTGRSLTQQDQKSDSGHTTWLGVLLADTDVVYHLAGRPGVQESWGVGFDQTCLLNVSLTQTVLEAALAAKVGRVVYASSSSVYGSGQGAAGVPKPVSPYGVSKLAGEHLIEVYRQRGLDTITLRYFTVFGPRQRPDMAFHRLIAATDDPAPGAETFIKRGSGEQRREFTFVSDVVEATMAAGQVPAIPPGTVIDVGGGVSTSLNEAISLITGLAGRAPRLISERAAPGDPEATRADIGPAKDLLGWQPTVTLQQGLARQLEHYGTTHRPGLLARN